MAQQRVKALAAQYIAQYSTVLRATRRTIGREAEFPVVNPDGTAGDVQRLLKQLHAQNGEMQMVMDSANGCDTRISSVKNAVADYTIEVGTGTIELIHEPYESVHDLDTAHQVAMERLFKAADVEGLEILGCGMQPVTPPSLDLMTARPRYHQLDELLGWGWRLFSATASDQVHVAMVASELPLVTSVTNAAMPAVIALLGNSSVHSGQVHSTPSTPTRGVACVREHGTAKSLGHRHGMPPGPVGSSEEFVAQILSYDYLLRPPEKVGLAPELARVTWAGASSGRSLGGMNSNNSSSTGSFASFGEHWESGREDSYDAFLHHDHYVWHSARPRPKQGTIEVRPACQQPHADSCVAAALGLGIVEAHRDLAPFLASFDAQTSSSAGSHSNNNNTGSNHGANNSSSSDGAFGLRGVWPELQQLHHQACESGLADDKVRTLAAGVLERASEGLCRRGLGEEKFLLPLFGRIEGKENPGQVAQAILAKSGMNALVKHMAKRS